MSVHPVARVGFGGTGLSAYEAARPSYPPLAIAHCIQRLDLKCGARVLDLAAGTGKLTQQLIGLGLFSVVAAEPSEGMCEAFARACPGTTVVKADASSLTFEDRTFDAVFVGQAFHWFANPEACNEIRRVLVPGGGLALIWNLEDGDQPWMREFLDIFQPYARQSGAPNYGLGTHLAALHSEWFAQLFDLGPGGPATCSMLFRSQRPLTKEGAWQRVLSNSFIASLSDGVREGEVRPAVAAWVQRHAAKFNAYHQEGDVDNGADREGAQQEAVAMFDIVTEAFICRRK